MRYQLNDGSNPSPAQLAALGQTIKRLDDEYNANVLNAMLAAGVLRIVLDAGEGLALFTEDHAVAAEFKLDARGLAHLWTRLAPAPT